MNGKQIAVILALIGAVAVLLGQQQPSKATDFESWKAKHGIHYASQFENAYRERIFLENLAKIEAHNSNNANTYEMGVNQFSAMTQEEFAETYLTLIVPENLEVVENNDYTINGDIDWTSQGAVTPVKNQGQCGSCWAFSATGGLEGLSKLAYGSLQSFSESQLVDCSGKYGNQACNGGLMDNAFKYVKDHGIVTEAEYPYKAVKQTCKIDSGSFKISGFTDIKNCNDLANALTGRPISVAVDATNWSPYKSGIFSNCKTSLNHGVTLVGMSGDSWVIKNSWGSSWGESGHVRLAKGNTCGVCNMASYPNK
jgi:C1A family cysteine protease